MSKRKSSEIQTDVGRRRTVTFLGLGAGLAVAGLLAPKEARAYYGKCWQCSCCHFEGNDNNCSNCGHRYEDHSGQTCNQVHRQP